MKIKQIIPINGPMPIRDPYILGVYHYDLYPKGNGKMGPSEDISDRKIGNDFDPSKEWRMYHGEKIPGFPHHPHRGFEICTIVAEGYADHFDSKGSKGRYGDGDIQLMSAGKGILHSEMFPLINDDKENPFRLFQIWINLPSVSKLTPPDYKMIWKENVPTKTYKDKNGNSVTIKVAFGEYEGVKAVDPLKYSWAKDPNHHMGIALVDLDSNAEFTLPAVSDTLTRFVLFYDGDGEIKVDEATVNVNQLLDLYGNEEITFKNGSAKSRILILEGEPINEPVAAYGPFVMNTELELQESFAEYRRTEFGGWPWGDKETDLVNPKETGRFASYNFDKIIDKP
jgi:quercetin 2,3-dioxygenase